MREFLTASFFLGHEEGEAARRLLRECDLLEAAEAEPRNRDSWRSDLHYGVILRRPADDPRIHYLLHVLRDRGINTLTRLEREYTRKELDGAGWLVLRVATAGLLGGVDFGQRYDFSQACPTCGAEARPIAPLIADLARMGKKDLDHLIYEGHLIASPRLAEGISGLTGVDPAPVGTRRRAPDGRFAWLRITTTLPRMSAHTYTVYRPCPECGRSGHYANPTAAEMPTYEHMPAIATDFNLTWEYFADWEQRRDTSHTRPIGGGPGIVVSQRARQRLMHLKVSRLVWVPVNVGS